MLGKCLPLVQGPRFSKSTSDVAIKKKAQGEKNERQLTYLKWLRDEWRVIRQRENLKKGPSHCNQT